MMLKLLTVFSIIRVSLLALRVKSFLHQMLMDAIVAAYTDRRGINVKNMMKEFAIELLANGRFYPTVNTLMAFLDALNRLFISVGASSRVKRPDRPKGERVVFATYGHVALVATKLRNVLEIAAGIRSSMRAGANNDVKYLIGSGDASPAPEKPFGFAAALWHGLG